MKKETNWLIGAYLTAVAVFFWAALCFGQSSENRIVEGSYFPNAHVYKNYVKNSTCDKNANNVTASGGSVTVSATNVLKGAKSCVIDATANGQTFKWATFTEEADQGGQNCEAKLTYNGDASLYVAYVSQGGARVTDQLALGNVATVSSAVAAFPVSCSSAGTDIVVESTGDGAAIRVDNLYYGKRANALETRIPANLVLAGPVSGASGAASFRALTASDFASAGISATTLAPGIASVAAASSVGTDVGSVHANAGGGSFTVTVPNAASVNTGQIMYLVKTDQTVNVVSMAGGWTDHLYTPDEAYLIQSNGTSWKKVEHYTDWTMQPETISVRSWGAGAAGPNPTLSAGDFSRWECSRDGKNLVCNIDYYKSGSGGSAGGGDFYAIRLPQTLSGAALIDTDRVKFASGAAIGVQPRVGLSAGKCFIGNGGTTEYAVPLVYEFSDLLTITSPTNNAFWKSNVYALAGAAFYLGCPGIKLPIDRWKD